MEPPLPRQNLPWPASHNLNGLAMMRTWLPKFKRRKHSKGPPSAVLCPGWDDQGSSLSSAVQEGLDRWADCDLSAATL